MPLVLREIINQLDLILLQKCGIIFLMVSDKCSLFGLFQHFCDKNVVNVFNNSMRASLHGRKRNRHSRRGHSYEEFNKEWYKST
jgi:hypothetical protein